MDFIWYSSNEFKQFHDTHQYNQKGFCVCWFSFFFSFHFWIECVCYCCYCCCYSFESAQTTKSILLINGSWSAAALIFKNRCLYGLAFLCVHIKLAYARAITCHVNCFPSIRSVLQCIAFTLNALFNSVVWEWSLWIQNECKKFWFNWTFV